jgi:hypothetical protein
MRFRPLHYALMALLCGASLHSAAAQPKPVGGQPSDGAGIEFFEKKIRPVLVQQCYACHSLAAGKSMGTLTLDSRSALLKGGQAGPAIVPGHPESSRLISAIRYAQPNLQMPPKVKLSDTVIADLTAWVRMGAPWPETRTPGTAGTGKDLSALEQRKRRHWAFLPVRKPQPPVVRAKAWPHNAIDRFILAKLEAQGLTPVPPADRRTLIRRAYFDVIGLPPTPEEVDAFLVDKSPNAWVTVVDRLLASPHYGERWGRYWLDVARYGEDQAHSFEPRLYPQGFRYRDWVAHALNSDMPYDRFVREQIAADLLDEPDMREQLPALGFFATGPVYYGDEKMYDQYDDRIDTLSRGFLGLTVACARCHDHKFDPISQKDYYALAGVFASTRYVEVPLGSADPKATFGRVEASLDRHVRINAQQQQLDKFLTEQQTDLHSRLAAETARYMVAAWKLHNRRKTDPKVTVEQIAVAEGLHGIVLERWVKYLKEGVDKNWSALADWRRMLQQEDAGTDLSTAAQPLAAARNVAAAYQDAVLTLMKRRAAANAPQTAAEQKSQSPGKADGAALDAIVGNEGVLTVPKDQIEKVLPEDTKPRLAALKAALEQAQAEPFVHALTEGAKIANVSVLLRGNPNTPGEEAPRHFLSILAGDNAPPFKQGSGRLELANAIADRNNPLTARVMVNRVWQHHFGVGLVRTASNFGLLGEPPTHPQLLDYLAAQFVEQGWSLKALHRQILLSATYQMSSTGNRRNEEIDPDDRLLWHMPGRRLDVEAWRDAMLAVTGKLDPTIGGPSVPLSAPENSRRTFYAAISRHDLDSMLRLFDYPDPNVTADARMTTTVPLQELFVLNSEFMIRQAKAFAARLTSDPGESDAARIRRAFLLAYNRAPDNRELLLGLTFLQKPRPGLIGVGLNASSGQAESANRLSRWEQYAQVLLSANEFLYVD